MNTRQNILSTQANQLQQKAANPYISAWVSASAGSGKTKVLTDRVLRLLLAKNSPETILCLTFTKAAAAEMANRLTKTLRKWVASDDKLLRQTLLDLIGEEPDDFDELIAFSRTLFARLLDVKGGFKIMTIHSFCQNLLKRFPLEAGVSPSFDIIEENEAKQLLKNAILKTLQDPLYSEDLRILSEYTDEKELLELFFGILKKQSKIENLLIHSGFENIREQIYLNLGVDTQMTPENLKKSVCPDGDFDAYKAIYLNKNNTIPQKFFNKNETEKIKIAESLLDVLDKINALKTAKATSAFLHIAVDVLATFNLLKEHKGVLDYTDLILKTGELLSQREMTSWVLYKLDGGIDHILLDEAQDTSPEQWKIIRAITEEFFAGSGHKDDKIRTLFAVGDKKQSIYRFQGADAREFEKMRQFFATRIPTSENVFEDIRLNISFRSTSAVLDMVNLLLQTSTARKGVALESENITHLAHRQGEAGIVEVWPLEKADKNEEEDDLWTIGKTKNSPPSSVKKLSLKIATRIRKMLDDKEILTSLNRPIRAGDIMILVRSRARQGIVDELLKALKEQNIPVSGIDRLILNKHIAIQDLISLGSFLLLPDDDLSLAEILKSPLFDISEETLFNLSYKRSSSLWASVAKQLPEIYNILKDLLSKADNMPPFELYSYVLDTLKNRQKFLSRLGKETNEMLDEFLNLCLKFEQHHTPSLESFLQFIKKDDIEIKRDLDNSQIDAVRIMTVHGSKGLQSKIVFIPDAYSKVKHMPSFFWKDDLPIWIPKAEMRTKLCQSVLNNIQSDDNDEYNRLLYVALTRAEDRLYICGFETSKKAPENNWYEMIANAIPSYSLEKGASFESKQTTDIKQEKQNHILPCFISQLPDWTDKKADAEPIPSKPLSPSKLTEDTAAPSPLTPEQEKAMRRGTFIHKLLQYLPQVSPENRIDFIHKNTPQDIDIPEHLVDLFKNPQIADLFSSNSESEVPIIGTTSDGKVISGQIDRLVIKPEEILIIDYKTNRYAPKTKDKIPSAYIEQLNAYKDLLKKLFPDKNIRSFLLWTTDLTLMEI